MEKYVKIMHLAENVVARVRDINIPIGAHGDATGQFQSSCCGGTSVPFVRLRRPASKCGDDPIGIHLCVCVGGGGITGGEISRTRSAGNSPICVCTLRILLLFLSAMNKSPEGPKAIPRGEVSVAADAAPPSPLHPLPPLLFTTLVIIPIELTWEIKTKQNKTKQ